MGAVSPVGPVEPAMSIRLRARPPARV